MMLSKEIEMRNDQGETVTASYEVFDDKLVMCFPDGTNKTILLNRLVPEDTARRHLKSYIQQKKIRSKS